MGVKKCQKVCHVLFEWPLINCHIPYLLHMYLLQFNVLKKLFCTRVVYVCMHVLMACDNLALITSLDRWISNISTFQRWYTFVQKVKTTGSKNYLLTSLKDVRNVGPQNALPIRVFNLNWYSTFFDRSVLLAWKMKIMILGFIWVLYILLSLRRIIKKFLKWNKNIRKESVNVCIQMTFVQQQQQQRRPMT